LIYTQIIVLNVPLCQSTCCWH